MNDNINTLDIMTFTLLPALTACGHTNAQGELLRNLVFDQNPEAGEYGCYSTFDLRPWCEEQDKAWRQDFWRDFSDQLDQEDIRENTAMGSAVTFECADAGVEACWYWDGDGTLVFNIYNRQNQLALSLVNDDCKKNYRWIQSHAFHRDYRVW